MSDKRTAFGPRNFDRITSRQLRLIEHQRLVRLQRQLLQALSEWKAQTGADTTLGYYLASVSRDQHQQRLHRLHSYFLAEYMRHYLHHIRPPEGHLTLKSAPSVASDGPNTSNADMGQCLLCPPLRIIKPAQK